MDVKGGFGYLRNPGDGYLYACSVGFPVTQGSDQRIRQRGSLRRYGRERVLRTASQWTLGVKLGSFAGSSFPNPGQTGTDYSWVRLDTSTRPRAIVYGWGKGDVTVERQHA